MKSRPDPAAPAPAPAPVAVKAELVELSSAMTAAEAFQNIAQACLRHFQLNLPLVLRHRDATALHQARVALRRLRSALAIHKPMLDARAEALNDELRWLAGELGKARDLDVLIEAAGDGPLRNRLLAARPPAYVEATAALQAQRARQLMTDVAAWIGIGDWLSRAETRQLRELPAREYAATALDRFRRKVRKGGRELEDLDDEARHEVRKAAKKLRYAAEFFSTLYDAKRERHRHLRFVAALEALQDRLGALNDLATAPDTLRALGLADDPQARKLLDRKGKTDLLQTAADAYDGLVDAKRFWR